MIPDVPSPIDLRLVSDALEWEATAMQKRPYRADFFARFVDELARLQPKPARVLELGSGPGFLAAKVLAKITSVRMTLLDFSEPMHALARQRLGPMANRAEFILADFKDSGWNKGLAGFDAVITNQAVHELRHKSYATDFHRQVAGALRPGGIYLVADHFLGAEGMTNDQLYMTTAEQKSAIESAGYASVVEVHLHGGMVLHRAMT